MKRVRRAQGCVDEGDKHGEDYCEKEASDRGRSGQDG